MNLPIDSNKIGVLGEELVSSLLSDTGYKILDRNYRKKWGEVDIVASHGQTIHFIEVKTVSREPSFFSKSYDPFSPEINVHMEKRKRLKRILSTYLEEKKISGDMDYQIDVATVYINRMTGKSKIDIIEDIQI